MKYRLSFLYITALLVVFCVTLYSQRREVRMGSVSMQGTHKAKYSLTKKINDLSEVINEAGKLNLDILLLPEAYFKGRTYEDDAQDLRHSIVLDSIKIWAEKHNVNIVFQIYEIVPEIKEFYNTAVVVDRKGEYVGKYRKVNLPPEENFLTRGDSYTVFNLDFGKIGVLICWDTWLTNPAKVLVDKGAEIILVPTWSNCTQSMKVINAENGIPISYSVLRHNPKSDVEDMQSSVYDNQGKAVHTYHYVGNNKIAVGVVELGNYTNIALNKKMNSSIETSENSFSKLVDGIYSTERDTDSKVQTSVEINSLPQWIEIDLGNDYYLNRVTIAQFRGEDYHYTIKGKSSSETVYVILSSDLSKLESVVEHGIAGSEILVANFETKIARQVRIYIDSKKRDDAQVNEIKIFGYIK